jgi:hypothetical protein
MLPLPPRPTHQTRRESSPVGEPHGVRAAERYQRRVMERIISKEWKSLEALGVGMQLGPSLTVMSRTAETTMSASSSKTAVNSSNGRDRKARSTRLYTSTFGRNTVKKVCIANINTRRRRRRSLVSLRLKGGRCRIKPSFATARSTIKAQSANLSTGWRSCSVLLVEGMGMRCGPVRKDPGGHERGGDLKLVVTRRGAAEWLQVFSFR